MKGKKEGKNELQSCSEWEDTHWYPLNYSSGKMERSKGEIHNVSLQCYPPHQNLNTPGTVLCSMTLHISINTHSDHITFSIGSRHLHTHTHAHTHQLSPQLGFLLIRTHLGFEIMTFFSLSVNLPITSTINHLISTVSECREKIQSTKRYLEMAGFVWQPV